MTERTEPKHATLPQLCSRCWDRAIAAVDANPSTASTFACCRHLGTIHVAIGHASGGRVQSWSLNGPLTERMAEDIAASYCAAIGGAVMAALTRGATKQ